MQTAVAVRQVRRKSIMEIHCISAIKRLHDMDIRLKDGLPLPHHLMHSISRGMHLLRMRM